MSDVSFLPPAVWIAATLVALATVVPIATIIWLWSRRVFSTRATALWTVAILVLSVPAAVIAVVAGNLRMRQAGGEPEPTSAP